MQSQKQMILDKMHRFITNSNSLRLCSHLISEFHSFKFSKTKPKSNHQSVKEKCTEENLAGLMHIVHGIVFGDGLFYSAVLGTVPTPSFWHTTVMNLTFIMIRRIEKKAYMVILATYSEEVFKTSEGNHFPF